MVKDIWLFALAHAQRELTVDIPSNRLVLNHQHTTATPEGEVLPECMRYGVAASNRHVDRARRACFGPRMKRCALLFWLLLSSAPAHAAPSMEGQAKALEERLLVPCCWTQTLDVHESPLATEMRLEIRSRLASGDTPLSIEDSFAQRHGERVRAMPRGENPMLTYVHWIGAVLTVALALLVMFARSWMKRAPRDPVMTRSVEDAALDEQLDQALARLNESATTQQPTCERGWA